MNISRKQKMIHVCSLFALVFIIAVFFILRGGKNTDNKATLNSGGLNTSIPSAVSQSISSDRFMAEKREEQKMMDRNRVETLQKNSFDLFNIDSSSPTDTGCTRFQTSSQSGETAVLTNLSNINGTTKVVNRSNAKEKLAQKNSIMRQKRAQLERELGINLSEYGYDKYEETALETNRKEEYFNDEYDSDEYDVEAGFYGLDSEEEPVKRDVRAVVHGDHNNLSSGSIVKMRLIDELSLDNVNIPVNTFVFGKLSFKSGRAVIQIQSINFRNRILKFKGSVYDSDGFEGIYVPENIISDTKNKAASDAIGGVDIDVSSKARILNSTVSAVGNAIKNAVSGSIKEAKISISSNYLVTIKKRR